MTRKNNKARGSLYEVPIKKEKDFTDLGDIRNDFNDMNLLIEKMDTHITKILTFHEEDFLRAYKEEMFILKKELTHLKDKINQEN